MCGIGGMVDLRGRAVDRNILQRMQTRLAHRGPDDRGIWIHETEGFSVGFVHCRLAVIDPTPEAHQPMLDPAGRFAITYNGELYNYRQLGHELADLRTASDTEVMLQACARWGTDALHRFDGMWAMAFVDTSQRRGHLSRDPLGIKPLYYLLHDDRLWFASELPALLAVSDWSRDLDPAALADYLALGFIPHPDTIYRAVRKLSPGHRLDFTANGICEPVPFYQLPPPMASPPAYPDACRMLREKIEQTVVSQRVADVPLGAFLSGGLDSSIVVAALARAGGPSIRTFSIGYADHGSYDETAYARQVASHVGTQHQEFRLTFKEVLASIEPMLNHLGEPFADSSLLPTSLVSQYTRQQVTVALSGDGGDELFGGYWRYLGHHYLRQYRRVPAFLRHSLVEPLIQRIPPGRASGLLNRVRQIRKLIGPAGTSRSPNALERHLAWSRVGSEQDLDALLGPKAATAYSKCLWQRYAAMCATPADDLQQILRADLAISLPGDMLHKVDTASMYHALEVRVPLLGRDVVEFATALPSEYKIVGARGKRLLRDAFSDVLPTAILNRPKMGFEVPIADFLRRELAEMYRDVVCPRLLESLGINPTAAATLYQRHAHRQDDHSGMLWGLLVLCWWARLIPRWDDI